jgi:hypothetical protein
MKFKRGTLETRSEATGTVDVIDVLSAFTCATFAFNAGAKEIFRLPPTVFEGVSLCS